MLDDFIKELEITASLMHDEKYQALLEMVAKRLKQIQKNEIHEIERELWKKPQNKN